MLRVGLVLLHVQILLLLVILPHMLLLDVVAPSSSKRSSSKLTAESGRSSSTTGTGSAVYMWRPDVLLQQLVGSCHDARQVNARCHCVFEVLADTPPRSRLGQDDVDVELLQHDLACGPKPGQQPGAFVRAAQTEGKSAGGRLLNQWLHFRHSLAHFTRANMQTRTHQTKHMIPATPDPTEGGKNVEFSPHWVSIGNMCKKTGIEWQICLANLWPAATSSA
jgi:hypothetical protein